jgi:hypothetical protein
MTKVKTVIKVDSEGIIVSEIPFPQKMALVRAGAIRGIKGADGKYIKPYVNRLLDKKKVNPELATVVFLKDHTKTAKKVVSEEEMLRKLLTKRTKAELIDMLCEGYE